MAAGGTIQVVIGPRQVGKITGIKQAMNTRGLYFTADSLSIESTSKKSDT